MDRLRSATSSCHRRLEQRLDITARFSGRDTYRVYLERMFGFHAPFEHSLSEHPVRRLIVDYGLRDKAPLLARDLEVLGVVPESIPALPCCARIPLCQDEAAAFGSLYVLEGATLGGRVLLPLVEQRLQLTAASGASYLASYGSNVSGMWRRFGAAAEEWCTDVTRRAAAAAAAVATFEALEDWLCGSPP